MTKNGETVDVRLDETFNIVVVEGDSDQNEQNEEDGESNSDSRSPRHRRRRACGPASARLP